MTRVEEDAEEGVAESAVDDLLQDAAGLADAKGPVPLDHCLEVGADETVDVVGDPGRQLALAADHEPGPAVQRPQTPKATVNGSPRAMGRSSGLSRPSDARGPAVSIR